MFFWVGVQGLGVYEGLGLGTSEGFAFRHFGESRDVGSQGQLCRGHACCFLGDILVF